ncbi:MAG: aromatic ring-hydroxylating dioxygenase subunit alpha [Mycolicibacterium hassiacum]|uniref:aromatic ring-hydroxylating oxygenase subunit alpha n=1 Tax=Mycolicibacterium hassiacum TaxID=46351 RepID=UPI0023F839A3|nr:aromatic ring-hydroxylating dioxygenase subunit alpha [Mycolicibacterium hassiacum]MBX5486850.1 aromatic ring-hydroxylating dioxygenase subunit alpha [Mycolicibacterium hassiacum]
MTTAHGSDLTGLAQKLAAATGNYDDAKGLPPECYTSEEIYDLERRFLFMREWLCVGRADLIPQPGDYYTVTLLGEPLIVVRQADDSVKVLSALCRHRGLPVTCPGDGEDGDWYRVPPETKGNAGSGFKCPYHFWVYGIDGALRGAPHMSRTRCFDKTDPDLSLPSLRTEVWQGFVFVNFDADAPSLVERLGPVDEIVANWGLGEMATEEPELQADMPWNWKIMHENSIDVYHVDRLHYPLHRVLPSDGYVPVSVQTGDAAIVLIQMATHKEFALSPIGRPLFPVIETLTEEERDRAYIILLPPTLLIILNSDSAFYRIVHPKGPNACDIRQTLMVPDHYRRLPNYAELVALGSTMHLKLNWQDYVVDAAIQRAATSMFAPRGPYAWNEQSVAEFDAWVARRYALGLGVGEPSPVVR